MSVDEIKKLLKSDALILGSEVTLKALRNNELVKVFLAGNAPEELIEEVNQLASLAKIEVEKLEVPNDELGVVCKKPFSIGCIGIKKTEAKKKF